MVNVESAQKAVETARGKLEDGLAKSVDLVQSGMATAANTLVRRCVTKQLAITEAKRDDELRAMKATIASAIRQAQVEARLEMESLDFEALSDTTARRPVTADPYIAAALKSVTAPLKALGYSPEKAVGSTMSGKLLTTGVFSSADTMATVEPLNLALFQYGQAKAGLRGATARSRAQAAADRFDEI